MCNRALTATCGVRTCAVLAFVFAGELVFAQGEPPRDPALTEAPKPTTAEEIPGKPASGDFRRLQNGDVQLGKITLHRKQGCLSFDAKVNQTAGPVEVLISTPQGRLHEALLRTEASPLHLQVMLFLLGSRNGPRRPDAEGRQGDIVDIDLQWRDGDKERREPVESWLKDTRENADKIPRQGWVFVGSPILDGMFMAETGGNVAVTYTVADTILDLPDEHGTDDTLFEANEKKDGPPLGAPVKVIVTPRRKQ